MFDFFKRSKRDVIAENREKGRAFEDEQDTYHTIMGRKIKKLPKGPDRKITETDWLTGRKKIWYEEYKSSSTAPLRPSQKEFMRKHPGKMKVIRPSEPFVFHEPVKKSMRRRKSKTKKRKRSSENDDYGFNMNNVFGQNNEEWF